MIFMRQVPLSRTRFMTLGDQFYFPFVFLTLTAWLLLIIYPFELSPQWLVFLAIFSILFRSFYLLFHFLLALGFLIALISTFMLTKKIFSLLFFWREPSLPNDHHPGEMKSQSLQDVEVSFEKKS
jgi:hypothetical protein